MGDYNIPIIEPAIDYTKVPPINQKRTIAFINHFISQTVTFLNKFALQCEEKLFEFENKLQKVEASLELLESRISSISGLEDGISKSHNSSNDTNSPDKGETKDKPRKIEEVEQPKIEETTPPEESSNTPPEESTNTDVDMIPIKLDPNYAKYFKMLHFGVPKPAVKIKMQQEGLDPILLDDPEKLVPKIAQEESSSS